MTRLLTVLLPLFVFSSYCSGENNKITDIASFKDFVNTHPEIQHIEDILPYFDTQVFSHHEVIYASRSIQESSVTYPRILYFNSDASFGIALNGDPSQNGYDVLEMFQAHDFPQAKFEFFAHSFNGDLASINKYRAKKGLELYTPVKRDCRVCHRDDLRPNWEDYSVRPGVIFNEDQFKRLKLTVDSSRYKYLKLGTRASFGPKAALHNYKRIVRKMMENKNFEIFKYALLGAVGGCEDIETFIPYDLKAHSMKSYAELQLSTRTSLQNHMRNKMERTTKDIEAGMVSKEERIYSDPEKVAFSEYSSVPGVAALRFTLQWMGLEMDDWSMVFSGGTFAMREPGNLFVPAYNYYTQEPGTPGATSFLNKSVPYPVYERDFFTLLSSKGNMSDVAYYKETPPAFDSGSENPPHKSRNFVGYVNCEALKKESLKSLLRWSPVRSESIPLGTHR